MAVERLRRCVSGCVLATLVGSALGLGASGALAAPTLRISPRAAASDAGECTRLLLALSGGGSGGGAAERVRLRIRARLGTPRIRFCRPPGGVLAEAVTLEIGLLEGDALLGGDGEVVVGVNADERSLLRVTGSVDADGDGRPEARAASTVAVDLPRCNDGVDNDGDGRADHPADRGCASARDRAETRVVRVPARASLRYADRAHAFEGRVRSTKPRCRRGRRIVIKKVRRGPDRRIARDRTGRRGAWRRAARGDLRGRFYARARRKTFVRRNGDKVVCRPRRTRTIRTGAR